MSNADDDNNNNNTIPPEDSTNPPSSNDTTGGNSSQTFQYDEAALEDPDDAALSRRGSSLGGGSGKALTFGAILLIGTVAILYYLFSDTPPAPVAAKPGTVPTKPSGQIIAQPSSAPPANIGAPTPSTPPAPPAPPPPPPPPPPPTAAKVPNSPPPKPLAPLAPPEIKAITASSTPNAAADKRSANRMRSNMLLLSGGGTPAEANKQDARKALDSNDPNAEFSSNAIAASGADKEMATKMSNLNRLIAQGKIVNAILETALNTDLPGTLRAIISRDVYAESGRAVLIPKGSRLIGTYNTGILRGQKRVMIVWTRVITPEGIDIQIGSPGTDALGRAGIEGMVDNKYMEAFSGALLTSMITVGIAVAADGNLNGSSTTTTNTDGSSTSSGSAGANAVNSAVKGVGDVASHVVGDLLDLRPTITIDQGARINVFVNKDLEFPGPDASGSLFVQ